MIFYSGLGLLIVPLAVLGILLGGALLNAGISSNISFFVGLFVVGLALYFLGKVINKQDELYRPDWTERLPKHNSFMFLKLEYWGALAIVLSVGFAYLVLDEKVHASASFIATSNAASRPVSTVNPAPQVSSPLNSDASLTGTAQGTPAPASPTLAPVQAKYRLPPVKSPAETWPVVDDGIARSSWNVSSEKDPMTGKTETKLVASADGRDGIQFEVEFNFKGEVFFCEVRSFRHGQPLELKRQGEYPYTLTPLRVRADDQKVFDAFGLAADYKNVFTVLFYDTAALQKQLDGSVDMSTPQKGMGSIFGNFLGTALLIQYGKAHLGKREVLPTLASVLFDISFADGSHQVLDLNPQQAIFRDSVVNAIASSPPAKASLSPQRRGGDVSPNTSGSEPPKRYGVILGQHYVPARTCPIDDDSACPSTGLLPPMRVEVLSNANGWYKVRYQVHDGRVFTGYVRQQFVALN